MAYLLSYVLFFVPFLFCLICTSASSGSNWPYTQWDKRKQSLFHLAQGLYNIGPAVFAGWGLSDCVFTPITSQDLFSVLAIQHVQRNKVLTSWTYFTVEKHYKLGLVLKLATVAEVLWFVRQLLFRLSCSILCDLSCSVTLRIFLSLLILCFFQPFYDCAKYEYPYKILSVN
jgi:hypothetical protein